MLEVGRWMFDLHLLVLAAALWLAPALRLNAANIGKTFASPEAAVKALTTAVNNNDSTALAAIFGPRFGTLESPDPVQQQNDVATFAERLNESHYIERTDTNQCILEVGQDHWPFAIPIVQTNGAWFFDTETGDDELLNRRIGRNELDVLKSVRVYVDAQREYASKDRNNDQVLQYAKKFISSPGKKDGLYWPTGTDSEISPLGPFYAEAQGEGYFKKTGDPEALQPFHGYYFKILTRQDKHAPGGAYDYIINGNMIGGFALVAWPAQYGNSGIMTFIVNQQGRVYQKDLGPNTDKLASNMNIYDPGPGWTVSRD
jgi:hypothetical protein